MTHALARQRTNTRGAAPWYGLVRSHPLKGVVMAMKSGYTYRDIAQRYMDAIDNGDMPHGEAFPGLMALAKEDGATPNTAYRVLMLLDSLGYIKIIPGKRAVVMYGGPDRLWKNLERALEALESSGQSPQIEVDSQGRIAIVGRDGSLIWNGRQWDAGLSDPDTPSQYRARGHQPVADHVADTIEVKIKNGTYGPGARLPGETALAHEYNIDPKTAHRAVQTLADRGLVERIRAVGTFVKRETA